MSHFPESLEGYHKNQEVMEIIIKISNMSATADHYLLWFLTKTKYFKVISETMYSSYTANGKSFHS